MFEVPEVKTSLRQNGWAVLEGVTTAREMLMAAQTLGRPVPAPTGELVKSLLPVEPSLGRPNTFSASRGRGEFPFHTDTAFWARPSRYLVMCVVGDRRRNTVLLHPEAIWDAFGVPARTAVERSVWRTPRYAGGIYCSLLLSYENVLGWRFDPQVMIPVNSFARCALAEMNESQVLACGPAGSLLIFHGSAWHGHTANTSARPRRSLQGAFIPRDGRASTDFTMRMRPETHARLSAVAQYVLHL